MGNGGWNGTDDEWERIEAPLKLLDPEFDRFARKHGLRVTKNVKDWPERSLGWGTDVQCLIQVFLVDQSALTLNFWICACQDRDGNRFWKNETPRKEVEVSDIAQDLFDLLEAGKRKLDHWSTHPEELEFVTTLGAECDRARACEDQRPARTGSSCPCDREPQSTGKCSPDRPSAPSFPGSHVILPRR